MDKFFGRQTTKASFRKKDNKNSPVSVKQIEFIIENLPTKDTPDSDGF